MAGMSLLDVTDILRGLAAAGITVWVDGGWCVDALVGRQLRGHDDLDIAVRREDETLVRVWFEARGYTPRPSADQTAWNFVLALGDRRIDVHVFAFDEHGAHVYGVEYPADALTGRAEISGVPVRCIAPEWMFRFKVAYEPRPKDLTDVHALAEKFGFDVPRTHGMG